MNIFQMLITTKIHKLIIIAMHLRLVLLIVVSLFLESLVMILIASLHVEGDMVAILIDNRMIHRVGQDQEGLQHMKTHHTQVNGQVNLNKIVNRDGRVAIRHLHSVEVAIPHPPLILERNVSMLEHIYLVSHQW